MATEAQMRQKFLNTLRGALGTGESPPGSNNNFIVQWYNKHVDRIGRGPWCEMTVTWAMWTSGFKDLKRGRAYTVWAAQDGQKGVNGSSWHYGTAGIKPGDQVYFDWGGQKGRISRIDHTGVIEKVNGDGTFYILEGNFRNKLVRTRRDSKYIVGYVRFNWDALAKVPMTPSLPLPKPSTRPGRDALAVRKLQSLIEIAPDGRWTKQVDSFAMTMRVAARAHAGFPQKVKMEFNVRFVQNVLDVEKDGVWGPKTQFALEQWIKLIQQLLGVEVDGKWGPATDNAFLKLRHNNRYNY